MIEAMTALMFVPALGSPIGTIPPPTRQDIATFYSRRGCRGSAMGTAVEYSSRFDRMQSLYPSYRRPDHSCINTRAAFSAGMAMRRCSWEEVCTLPTVPVDGTRPPAPAPSPHQPWTFPNGGGSGGATPPPLEGQPNDTLEDALEDLETQTCASDEDTLDLMTAEALTAIKAAEAARKAAGLPWIEHGVVFYRQYPGGPILVTPVKEGNLPANNRLPYSIDMPWPESGQILGGFHTHPFNARNDDSGQPNLAYAVPSGADWDDLAAAAADTNSPLSQARMYIAHNGQVYQYTRVDEGYFTQDPTGRRNPLPTSDQQPGNATPCPPEV